MRMGQAHSVCIACMGCDEYVNLMKGGDERNRLNQLYHENILKGGQYEKNYRCLYL